MKKFLRKTFVKICVLLMGAVCVGGVVAACKDVTKDTAITASAADLGIITIETYEGEYTWLASTNRILFQLPDTVSAGSYTLQSGGTISLTRGNDTWTRGAATEDSFVIQNFDGYDNVGFIALNAFDGDVGGAYEREAGDVFVINGAFSDGINAFTIENITIVVNSATSGDMYVEKPAVNAGYGVYVAEWENAWPSEAYYPQMHITANAAITAGTYSQAETNAITLKREDKVYTLPTGNYLTVGEENGGVQQIDFSLAAFSEIMDEEYAAKAGDILTVNGKFTNGAISFEIQKTEITNLVGKPKIHSVVPVYEVKFTNEDGNVTSSIEVRHNERVKKPADAVKEADGWIYEFDGWYNGDIRWDFSLSVTSGMTLTPKFNGYVALGKGVTYLENSRSHQYNEFGNFYEIFFGVENDSDGVENYSAYYALDAAAAKLVRGSTVYQSIVGAEVIKKYEDDTYLVYVQEGATFETGFGKLQDGDVIILDGLFVKNDGSMQFKINQTAIRLSLDEDEKIAATISNNSFSMLQGAAIRLNSQDDKMGIRFEAELGYAYDEDAEYYMMIVPVSYLKAFHITGDYYTNLVGALAAAGKDISVANMKCVPFQYTEEEISVNGRNTGSYYIRGSLTTIKYDNINTKFIGVGYMIKDGVYTYCATDIDKNARSLAEVASKALSDTATYPDGNRYLEGFVKDAFTQSGGAVSDAYALNKTTLEGSPVCEQLSIVGIPTGADVKAVWSSSDSSVAAVDEDGNVIGMASGNATITAIFLGQSYICNVVNTGSATVAVVKDGGIVTWGKLASLSSCEIRILGENGATVYEVTRENNVLDLTKLDLTSGAEYTLFVRAAVGENATEWTSFAFTYEDYNADDVTGQTQLSAVVNLVENAGDVRWDAVENANAYEVVVVYNGEEIFNETVTETTFTMDRLLGDYTVTVYAKNDGKYVKSVGMTV